MNPPEPRDARIDALTAELLDGTLRPGDEEELRAALLADETRARDVARLFVDHCLLESVVLNESSARFIEKVLASLKHVDNRHGFVADVMNKVRTRPARRRRRAFYLVAALGAACLLIGLGALLVPSPSGTKERTEARRETRDPEKPQPVAPEPVVPVETPPQPRAPEPFDTAQGKPVEPKPDPKPLSEPVPPPSAAPREPVKETPSPPRVPQEETPAPKEKPLPTLTQVARLAGVQGDVFIGSGGAPAKAGQAIVAQEGLRTVGPESLASFTLPDGTWIQLGPDSTITGIAAGGKAVSLSAGALLADVPRQPAGQALAIITPHATAEGQGAQLMLSVTGGATRLDVVEGKVRLARKADGKSVDVSAGYFAQAAPGADLIPRRQDPKARKPGQLSKVDQAKVDEAIRRGIAFLKKLEMKTVRGGSELVLWTLLHGGVPESDPAFQELFGGMMAADLERTYRVSLQAMVLEELDRVRHQKRIWQCAQFLVDNQGPGGSWSYGEPTLSVQDVPTLAPRKNVATGKKPEKQTPALPAGARRKPAVEQKIPVAKKRDGANGDHSNSQYAALGLRACHDAGILLPREVIERAQSLWQNRQMAEPGGTAGGGWCYTHAGNCRPYGSMTAGGAGSLVIYKHILGQPWTKDKAIEDGLKWLTNRFAVTCNPGPFEGGAENSATHHYYYLYALERAGILYGTEVLGHHEWYPEGVQFLLKVQKPDGSWDAGDRSSGQTEWDTCFAILFLRRATRPLIDVPTEDRFKPK